jgi:hypothetical protein
VNPPILRLLAASALVVSLATPARAAEEAVTLNFVNADIEAVVKAVAEMTGRNFVLDPRVKGVINIVSARPVPTSLVYPTLLSALRLQGFTAIETDGLTKIVPEADAKQHGTPVTVGRVGAGGDRLVTEVYVLKSESAAQLVNVLRPLIRPNNSIAAVPSGNALVITDYADNLKRIDRIIASLDVPPAGEPIIVPLRYASAIDLVQMLSRLLAETGTAPGTARRSAAAGLAGGRSPLEQRAGARRQPDPTRARARADRTARHSRARRRQHLHHLSQECRGGACRADAARAAHGERRRGCVERGRADGPGLVELVALGDRGRPGRAHADGHHDRVHQRRQRGLQRRRRHHPGRRGQQRAGRDGS